MIVHSDDNHGSTNIFDVINERTCSDFADFNLTFFGRGVGAKLPGTPVLCGSVVAKGDTNSFTCYKFYQNGGSQEFVRMEGRRDNAAGIVYRNKFHVFGGVANNPQIVRRTSVIISRNGEVIDGPFLPIAVYGHAITTVNSSMSIISGGFKSFLDSTNQTWYYNHETKNFTPGPTLHESRGYHGSATIIDRMTKVKIPVVTGGYRGQDTESTELLIKGQWQTGINQ